MRSDGAHVAVDGVIGENGGLFFRRSADGHGVTRSFWHTDVGQSALAERLAAIGRAVLQAVPAARFADDQPFRLTSLAFAQPDDESDRHAILAALQCANTCMKSRSRRYGSRRGRAATVSSRLPTR